RVRPAVRRGGEDRHRDPPRLDLGGPAPAQDRLQPRRPPGGGDGGRRRGLRTRAQRRPHGPGAATALATAQAKKRASGAGTVPAATRLPPRVPWSPARIRTPRPSGPGRTPCDGIAAGNGGARPPAASAAARVLRLLHWLGALRGQLGLGRLAPPMHPRTPA